MSFSGVVSLVLLLAFPSSTVNAQGSPSSGGGEIDKVKVGQTVTLILTDGNRVKGKVSAISGGSVSMRETGGPEPRLVR